jgi:hypothetical protein
MLIFQFMFVYIGPINDIKMVCLYCYSFQATVLKIKMHLWVWHLLSIFVYCEQKINLRQRVATTCEALKIFCLLLIHGLAPHSKCYRSEG